MTRVSSFRKTSISVFQSLANVPILAGLLIFASCADGPRISGDDNAPMPGPGDIPPMSPEDRIELLTQRYMNRVAASPSSIVSGKVLSVDEQPVSGISVRIGKQTTVTDSLGHYTLPNISVGHHVITFEHPLYVLTQRPVSVLPTQEPQVDVNLLSRSEVQSFDADEGGSVTDGPLAVHFEPNDLVFLDGTPVHGRIDVLMTVIDPRKPRHVLAAPARLEGIDPDGAQVGLISYGMAEIEVSQGGKKLQVRPGRSVTASMNINGLYGLSPEVDSIPMWHLDTDLGVWVQERNAGTTTTDASGRTRQVGAAVVQRGATGALLATAELPHFSSWNWDVSSGATCTILTVPSAVAISGVRVISTDSAGTFDNLWTVNAACQLPRPTGTACIANSPSGNFGGTTFFKYQALVNSNWCDLTVVLGNGVEKTVLQGNDINNWLTGVGLTTSGAWCGIPTPNSGFIAGTWNPQISISQLPTNRASLLVSSSLGTCSSLVGGRTANLSGDLGFRTMTMNAISSSRLDVDRDGIGDGVDNCVANSSSQFDSNSNRIGDACEDYCIIPLNDPLSPIYDFDRDGIDDLCDNRYTMFNPSQYIPTF